MASKKQNSLPPYGFGLLCLPAYGKEAQIPGKLIVATNGNVDFISNRKLATFKNTLFLDSLLPIIDPI